MPINLCVAIVTDNSKAAGIALEVIPIMLWCTVIASNYDFWTFG